ncbi:hypothetical protein [Methylibium sp.]|uniref:hypothetical protein n=1 Tax=Methylibium sp. TaxID=2067992 RepID=UPI0017B0AD96|nr:hypothetical protein [Methylibium sp.]MBA3589688.1 hypothetical protein [Methylibium sp.]
MSASATPIGRRIVADFVGDFDWHAKFEHHEIGDPVGFGPTRQSAINDLIAKLGDRQ